MTAYTAVCVLSCVRLFANSRTIAHYDPLLTGFYWQEYWSGLTFPLPSSGDLPHPGIKPTQPVLAGRSFTTVLPLWNFLIPKLQKKISSIKRKSTQIKYATVPFTFTEFIKDLNVSRFPVIAMVTNYPMQKEFPFASVIFFS